MPSRRVNHINTKCCICGSGDTGKKNGYPHWNRYKDKDGKWDEKSYVCDKCQSEIYRNLPDSLNNKMKIISRQIKDMKLKNRKCCRCESKETYIYKSNPKWLTCTCEKNNCTGYLCHNCHFKIDRSSRYGYLNKDSETGKGLIGEAVIAKVRCLDIITIKLDKFNSRFDLSCDPEYRMIQSKIKRPYYGDWSIVFGMEHNFDTALILCKSKDDKSIDRAYAIPEKELYGIVGITITKNGLKWEGYKINENIYNEAYQDIMYYLKDRKYFDIEDIKKWLKR